MMLMAQKESIVFSWLLQRCPKIVITAIKVTKLSTEYIIKTQIDREPTDFALFCRF